MNDNKRTSIRFVIMLAVDIILGTIAAKLMESGLSEQSSIADENRGGVFIAGLAIVFLVIPIFSIIFFFFPRKKSNLEDTTQVGDKKNRNTFSKILKAIVLFAAIYWFYEFFITPIISKIMKN